MKGILEKRCYDSDFELWCRCYRDVKFLAHYHTEAELILVREGEAKITVNNQVYICRPGDMMLICPGDIHFNEYDSSSNILDFLVFNPVILGKMASSRTAQSCCLSYGKTGQPDILPDSFALFDFIHKELQKKGRFYDVAIQSRIRSFWVEYLRCFAAESQENTAIVTNRLSRVRVLLDYIDSHYHQDIPLAQAAELLGYDTCHCSKTFKAATGVNFVTYLNTVRVGKALEQLRGEKRNIIDIAIDCGFHNTRTFNRVFKEILQVTPTEYLKRLESGAVKAPENLAQNHTVLSFADSWI